MLKTIDHLLKGVTELDQWDTFPTTRPRFITLLSQITNTRIIEDDDEDMGNEQDEEPEIDSEKSDSESVAENLTLG